MRFLDTLAAVGALAGLASADAVNDLEAEGRIQLDATIAQSTTCSPDKLMVRREWGDISVDERKAWIAGFQCLLNTPSRLDPAEFPGSKSLYDDFVVIHMNQTLTIHGTGNFLVWHRYYTWLFEHAMRTECGYTGTQPYWDYGRWADDPLSSPLFDGSDSSLGGNGAPVEAATGGFGGLGGFGGAAGAGGAAGGAGAATGAGGAWGGWGLGGTRKGRRDEQLPAVALGRRQFAPAGDGGGCISTGPFANMTVHLGPMAAVVRPQPSRNPQANGYGDNPRCIRRDITNYLSTRFGKTSDIVSSITNFDNILRFQNFMQGGSGVHGVGHFTVSGDPGGDFYISPNEPSFWLHHAMIDRVWTIWQSLDYENRRMAMEGGTSMMGFGSRQQSLDDPVWMNVLSEGDDTWLIRDLMSTVDGPGPFCYVYE